MLACGLAQAKQTDKNQKINVEAGYASASQGNGKLILTGGVTVDQGTFHADGAQATGYTDPNDTSEWQRVVLTGAPAHFHQTQDNGALVQGQATTIDYKISENAVILTGDATVVQQGRGTFHGEKLTYNTDTGEIEGTAAPGGRVHITLQPRSKPAPASAKPAAAGTAAATSSAPPASSSTAVPASASTTGSH